MTRFNRLIVEWPKLVLLLGFLITAGFGRAAAHLRIDSSVQNLYDQNDPNKQYYDEVRKLFGSDDMGVIGLVTDNVYTPATLGKIKRITADAEQVEGVQSVQSLTNLPDPTDVIDSPLLIPQIPTNPVDLDKLRQKVEANPICLNVISRDGKGAAVLIFFDQNASDDVAAQKRRDDRLQEIVTHEQGPEQLYLSGMQHITLNETQLMQSDLRTFTPLTLAAIVLVLGFCFRNIRGVVLPLMAVLCGVVWTLGTMVLAGDAITMATVVLPTLLIVIGSTYSIYIIAQYEDELPKGGTAAEVTLRALERVSVPVTVAAFTTVVGFVTLLVSRIGTIRALGFYAAIGFASLTLIVLTLMPAVLALLPLPRRSVLSNEPGRLVTLLARVSKLDRRYRVPIMLVAAVLVIPCIWGITRIRADTNFIEYFKKSSPVRRANEIISAKIGGTQNFDVIVDTGKKGGAMSLDTLQRIRGLQAHLATWPGIDQTLSIVDYSELVDRAIQSGKPPGTTGPSAQPATTTFWQRPAQLEGVSQMVYVIQKNQGPTNAFASVLSADSAIARIIVRTRLTSSRDIVGVADEVRRYGKEHFPPEVTVRPTGSLILLSESTDDVVWGQVKSLGFALIVIFVVLSLMFLSVKVGFLSLLPNLLAILLLFGVMGLTGITLNLGTSIIASIAIGIAVEDAIRYLARLSDEIRTTHDQEKALFETIATVGKPIIYASAALGLGFLVFLFSNFVPIQKFGFLTALTIVVAFVNDLVLLPALLSTTRIITLWDVIYLKLGKDPEKTIGLFEGLRPSQAKIVTLMGALKTFPEGAAIVRQGELGNEMFVVISGKAKVQINADGESRVVRQLKRGDVFGEMGLIRHHQRTADVIATEEVEALAVNERFLTLMQRRYPRIGAKVFLNVAKILSNRLEERDTARS